MSDEIKFTTSLFFNFEDELEQMMIVLQASAETLARRLEDRVEQMMLSGMGEEAILDSLLRDLHGGGPIFSGVTGTFKSNTWRMVDNISQGAVTEVNDGEDRWEWITTSASPCEDCSPRHGEVDTYESWRDRGLPRSGFSVCDMHCKCILVPASQVTGDFGEAVTVPSIGQYRKEFRQRLETDEVLQKRIELYKQGRRKARSK